MSAVAAELGLKPAARLATACADRLLERLDRPEGTPTAGFAEGQAGIGWGVATTLLGIMAGISMNAYRLERLRRAAEAPGTGEERRAA